MVASPRGQRGFIIIHYRGLLPLIKNTQTLIDRLEDPDMASVVRGAASVWRDNYNTEGGQVGGWRPLSEYTQNIRMWRGYSPAHPILKQSGGLRRAAIEYPAQFYHKSMNRTTPPTPMSDGGQTTITIRAIKNRAELILTGAKALNQYPGRSMNQYGEGFSRPARKFWFANDRVRMAAAEKLVDSLEDVMRKFK